MPTAHSRIAGSANNRMARTKGRTSTPPQTPFDLGYWMPAEWEHHHATWLGWPHEQTDWPGKFPTIPWAFAEIVRHLTRVERVYLLVQNRTAESKVRAILKKSGANLSAVDFFRVPTDRGWMRDSGPISISNSSGEVAFTHWRFNGWAKYTNHKRDAVAAMLVNNRLKQRVWQPMHKGRRVVLEGGSIDVNGCGALLTTEECLLSTTQQRNPPMDRAAYEQLFADYFGVQSVIWLDSGIAGDDTHGHVDDITRFVASNTVVTMIEQNARSENYAPLRANLGRLKNARTADGKKLEIVE